MERLTLIQKDGKRKWINLDRVAHVTFSTEVLIIHFDREWTLEIRKENFEEREYDKIWQALGFLRPQD